ncbi:dienelactone hydrolase family protein [Caballeronia sordidicola]|uniref:dienelactone hydrolase family protein n=1 Tax=Caballeronia sordidicola TaxID=196367 RepID=UPI0004CFF0A3|nr:dienelactone hydrolase family protein [Caballeronia sordidicola]
MTEVSISTPHHLLKGYVATPRGEGPWPGVIVLHDIFGLTDVTRGHADWLAREGYLAVALDLFSWGGRLRCIRALMAGLSARKGPVFDDVDAVRQWLEGREDCTGKTGVIGFCVTGSFAILLAAGHGFSASAPNYGPVPNDIDAIMDGACPVVAGYGGRDRRLKGAAARLKGALERNNIEHDVKEYPDAGHSFLDDHKGLIGVLGVVIGATYKDKDAADARGRIQAFFARHLA